MSATPPTGSRTCRLRHRQDPGPVAYATDKIPGLSPTPPTRSRACRLRHRQRLSVSVASVTGALRVDGVGGSLRAGRDLGPEAGHQHTVLTVTTHNKPDAHRGHRGSVRSRRSRMTLNGT